jgi:23S rRNA (adenine2503-C2)-methyltransferase
MSRANLLGLLPAELEDLAVTLGASRYRGRQLATWMYRKGVVDLEAMTDLPRDFRARLAETHEIRLPELERATPSQDGSRKLVFRLADGSRVSAVLMPDDGRITLCLSTQVGCGYACAFCLTGTMGLERNLDAAEIVGQVIAANALLDGGERVTHIVFMGMGEPLANYKAVLGAVRRLTDPAPDGLGLSQRSVTVSTVGLVPAMDRLTREGLNVTLALSLHAPDDELRDTLVPVNTRWKVAEVLDAARRYFEATGRRVSIEYALIRDVNDHAWRADLLGTELNRRGRGWVHVNPIPLNPTPGSRWTASDPKVERAFVGRLRAHGVPTTVRDTRGREIDGACGQLATVTA